MSTPAIVAAMLARPLTHTVVTTWSDGTKNELGVRSMAQAENHKITMSRMAGRDVVSRETGAAKRVVSIEIAAL